MFCLLRPSDATQTYWAHISDSKSTKEEEDGWLDAIMMPECLKAMEASLGKK